MTIEIKQGDKVRVSKDAPKLYTDGWRFDWRNLDSVVGILEGDDATITPTDVGEEELSIPTKYLVKVGEEYKPKFKKGDKVRYIGDVQEHKGQVFVIDGDIFFNDYFNQWQASSIKTDIKGTWGICNVPLSDLVLYTDPTAPIIKVGDRVRNIESGLIGVVDKIVYGNIAWVNCVDGKRYHWKSDGLELIEPTAQTEEDTRIRQMEAELDEFRKTELDRMLHPEKYYTYEVTIDNVAMNWQRYEADLAKEVAVMLVRTHRNDLNKVAKMSVDIAKAVAERLKRK